MKKIVKLLAIIVLGSMFLLSISACYDNSSHIETVDVGATYFEGKSVDEGIVYLLESAYWNHHFTQNGETWTLAISIKITNNTAENYVPNSQLLFVYCQNPEIEVSIDCKLLLPTGDGGYASGGFYPTKNYVEPEQTAYLSIRGNDLYTNPTLKYVDNFYLVHKIQTELGLEVKTFNLGVLIEQ